MFVFVTGGSGYIGRHVINRLVGAGHEVSALARSDASEATVREHGAAEVVRGELTDLDVLRDAAAKADATIHLGAGGDDPAAVDRAAAQAMQEGAGEKPYLHTGGLWIYGDTHGEVVDETAPFDPPELTAWRIDNEREVLERGGHPVIVMPAVVYGERAGIIHQVLVGEGAVHCVGDGDNRWGLVHVEDCADLYVRALEAPAGERYLAVTECLRQREICDAVAIAPEGPGRVAPWTVEEATNKLGAFAGALLLDQQLTSQKAKDGLGWEPQHTDALAELRTGAA